MPENAIASAPRTAAEPRVGPPGRAGSRLHTGGGRGRGLARRIHGSRPAVALRGPHEALGLVQGERARVPAVDAERHRLDAKVPQPRDAPAQQRPPEPTPAVPGATPIVQISALRIDDAVGAGSAGRWTQNRDQRRTRPEQDLPSSTAARLRRPRRRSSGSAGAASACAAKAALKAAGNAAASRSRSNGPGRVATPGPPARPPGVPARAEVVDCRVEANPVAPRNASPACVAGQHAQVAARGSPARARWRAPPRRGPADPRDAGAGSTTSALTSGMTRPTSGPRPRRPRARLGPRAA